MSNYHGHDGHEQVTPIGVIKEIYSSDQPYLLTMLHLSFSELFQNMQIWASLNDSNQVLIQLLVLIKIFALVYYLLSLCKNCCQIIRDFQDFRNRQNQERQNYRHQGERAYPLVSYR